MMYVMYLNITRTILDVFNCGPVSPPDGKMYLQVVFEECGVKGGVQMRLKGWAIAAMIVYVIGYPVAIAAVLWFNQYWIQIDQVLRAMGLGYDRNSSSDDVLRVRTQFHKLYYAFRPDTYYWMLVIVVRKFSIAFCSLMFSRNPAFQLAMSLLVMFAAFTLQVKVEPYMSPSQMNQTVEYHLRESKRPAVKSIHARIR